MKSDNKHGISICFSVLFFLLISANVEGYEPSVGVIFFLTITFLLGTYLLTRD